MAELHIDWEQVHRHIENTTWGHRGLIVRRYAQRFGCSTDTVRRELRRRFGPRKTRTANPIIDPQNHLIGMIFDMKLMGEMMHLKRRELATELCIQKLVERGVPGADELTASTVNRRLQELGYRERQPSKRIEALYANQVHMIDFSRSKYFQLWERDDDDDFMLKVSGRELHYKQDDARLRTWIVQYLDDFSRLRKVRAYAETNESAWLGLDHLNYCWLPDPESEHLLRYLPAEMLRSDNGAWRKSQETQTAMAELNVPLPAQMPGHKGGTAKVENRFRSLWQQFELPLAVQLGDGARIRLSEYNELLEEFTINEHNQQHPVHKDYTKGAWYQKSLAERSRHQRVTEVDVIRIACRVEKRVVDSHLRVSLNGTYYEVPHYVDGISTVGKTIYIHINKYNELTGKLIDDLAVSRFELTAWQPATWGTFESFAKTPRSYREAEFERTGIPDMNTIVGEFEPKHVPEEPVETEQPNAVKYMPPRVAKEEATTSAFADQVIAPTGRVFKTVLDARAWIGGQIETYGLRFSQVEGYFEQALAQPPIYEHELTHILQRISQDWDAGRIAM